MFSHLTCDLDCEKGLLNLSLKSLSDTVHRDEMERRAAKEDRANAREDSDDDRGKRKGGGGRPGGSKKQKY